MQVQDIFLEDIKPLKFCYIFHFILYVLIFILHFIIYNKLFWIKNAFQIIFSFSTYFIILFYILPLIAIILLYFKYYKLKIFLFFKKLSYVFFILSIIIGLITCTIFWINTAYSMNFCKECPLSYTEDNLNYTFSNYYGQKMIRSEKIENKCNAKRCILFNEDINEKYAYAYLCNYELNEEKDENNDNSNAIRKNEYKRLLPNGTELISDNEFICYQLEPTYRQISFNNNIYYDYIDLCSYCTQFFICERFSEPKNYTIKNNEICPEDNYLILLYVISVLILLTDIIISLLPWFIEYISFKKILLLIENNESTNNSNVSTKKSTGNSNSNSNKSESFKKEEALIIVAPINKEENKKDNIKEEKMAEIKELEKDLIFGEIDMHNVEKGNRNEDIKDIKEIKDKNNMFKKNNIDPLIIEESDRNDFKSENKDIKNIPTTKNNNYFIEENNENITNLKKKKNEKK